MHQNKRNKGVVAAALGAAFVIGASGHAQAASLLDSQGGWNDWNGAYAGVWQDASTGRLGIEAAAPGRHSRGVRYFDKPLRDGVNYTFSLNAVDGAPAHATIIAVSANGAPVVINANESGWNRTYQMVSSGRSVSFTAQGAAKGFYIQVDGSWAPWQASTVSVDLRDDNAAASSTPARSTVQVAALPAGLQADLPAPAMGVDRYAGAIATALDYWGDNNTWGLESRGIYWGQYQQTIGLQRQGSDTVALRTTWQVPDWDGSVKGYPAVVYGQKPGLAVHWGKIAGERVLAPMPAGGISGETGNTPLPMALPIGELRTQYKLDVAWTSGVGHVSYDIWLQSTPTQFMGFRESPITHEIMIPLYNWGGYGTHPWGRSPTWYDHDITIDGIDYAVYIPKVQCRGRSRYEGAALPIFGGLSDAALAMTQRADPGSYPALVEGDGVTPCSYNGRSWDPDDRITYGWRFIVFQPKVLPMPAAARLDLAKFINHITTRRDRYGIPWATGREHLMSVELGVENVQGGGDVTISQFKVGQGF